MGDESGLSNQGKTTPGPTSHYNQFSVGSASEEVSTDCGGFTGVGTDRFASHPLNGMKFSTPDNDNDKVRIVTVQLTLHKSGWWYNRCFITLININRQKPPWDCMKWYSSLLRIAEMKIRPKDCIIQ